MFISQVTFETEKANEEQLKGMMKKKMSSAGSAEGLISAECWAQESKDNAAYSMVTKWDGKSHFQTWLSKDHARGGKAHGAETRSKFTKTTYRYEPVDFSGK